MFSLVITIIAVALVALLALAAVFYGLPALRESGAKTRSTGLISQSAQILGAAELYTVDHKEWPQSTDELVSRAYLSAVPSFRSAEGLSTEWTLPMPGVPVYWVLKSTDTDTCRWVNRKVRGDNGIYNMARPGLLVQCFGKSAPYTTIATRQGLSEGLDGVIDHHNGQNPGSDVGYDESGGGWAVPPDQGPGTPTTPVDPQPPLSGLELTPTSLSWASEYALGSYDKTVTVRNGTGAALAFQGAPAFQSGQGDFEVASTTCGASLGATAPGNSCTVTVRYLPDNAGAHTGQLALSFATTPAAVATLPLNGQATSPLRASSHSSDLPNARVNSAYASSPDLADAWELATGAPLDKAQLALEVDTSAPLPAGLTLNASTRKVEGTPTVETATPAKFKVKATYQAKFEDTREFTIFATSENLRLVSISSKGDSTCAVTSEGQVKCWGANSAGQLGDGTVVNRNKPVTVAGLGGNASQVSVGMNHACALMMNGTLRCWGDGGVGQLGNGRYQGSLVPVDPGLSGVKQVALGDGFSCAVLTSGQARCWGNHSTGQLGTGSSGSTAYATPQAVVGSGYSSIGVGMNHACATTSSGQVRCWGLGTSGQLGDGTQVSSYSPLTIAGVTDAAKVVAGAWHSCYLTTAGTVKCWGWNGEGQLGDGTTTRRLLPVDTRGPVSDVADLVAGPNHTCLSRGVGRILMCWGQGTDFKTAQGSTAITTEPSQVFGRPSSATVTALGAEHSCWFAATGNTVCRGNNAQGQLGDGTNTNSGNTNAVVAF